MTLPFDWKRINSYGIGSPYRSVTDVMVPDPLNVSRLVVDTNKTTISLHDITAILFNVKEFQKSNGIKYGGWGIDPLMLLSLLGPAMLWFLGLLLLRSACRKPLERFGMYMGVITENEALYKKRLALGKRGRDALSPANQRKIYKFYNQLWLTFFYAFSTLFGYIVQYNEPWFTFPLNDESSVQLLLPHPYNPSMKLVMYYQYSLAFYVAELVSLIFSGADVKQSDFIEYVMHHFVTLMLMVCSYIGWEHRFGVYTLFIHDVSDVVLSFTKALHYVVKEELERVKQATERNRPYKSPKMFCILKENLVNFLLAIFVVSFFYLRLYCLPMMARATIGMTPRLRHGNFNMWCLVLLLNVALQTLHVYWAWLIIRLIFTLVTGGDRKDIRSGSDEDEDEGEEPDYTS